MDRGWTEVNTYKIVDTDTGNTVGFYRTHGEAERSFQRMLEEDPGTQCLALVSMDKDGHPLGATFTEPSSPSRSGWRKFAAVLPRLLAPRRTA